MKYLKMLGLAAVAAMALTALVGAGTASATALYSGATKQGVNAELKSKLTTGNSALLKDTGGSTNDTCTGSEVAGKITNAGGAGVAVVGKIESLTFTGCSHKTVVIAKGELELKWTSGLNGTVVSKGAEVTVESTVFGISCTAKTGTGTTIGTFTGVTSGDATMDINGVIPMGALCGDSTWTGNYTVSAPTPLHATNS